MFLFLTPVAHAAEVALVLPAGEDTADWAGPAALAGFVVVRAASGRCVELSRTEAGWSLVVRDGAGGEKRVAIATPSTPQTREDAIWLGSSLLGSLPDAPAMPRPIAVLPPAGSGRAAAPERSPVEGGPAREPPGGRPRSPAPPVDEVPDAAPSGRPSEAGPAVAAVAEPPRVAGTPAGSEREPEPPTPVLAPAASAPPEPAPIPTPEVGAAVAPEFPPRPPPPRPEPWRPRLWASLGPAIETRGDTSLTGGAMIEAGLRVGTAGWLGVGVRWLAPRTIPAIPAATSEASTDAWLGAWWSPAWSVAPWAGLTLGMSTRDYRQGEREVGAFVVPVAGVEAGGAARLGPHLDLLLFGRVSADGSTTFVEFGEREPVALSPWAFSAALSLRGTLP